MRIHRFLFCLLMMVVTISSVMAQEDDKPTPYRRPEGEYSRDTVNPNNRLKSLEPKKKFDWSKILIEPNVQFFFAQNYLQFGLMPSVGYNVWKNMYVGASLHYNIQVAFNDPIAKRNLTTQVYGGGPFIHYRIWKGVFARLRFEQLAVRFPYLTYTNEVAYKTVGTPYIWLGVGYNLTPSRNLFIPLAFYFNPLYYVTDNTYSPYQQAFYLQVAFYIFSPRLK